MSMGNQTMSNMQFNVPLDVDLDNLIDEMVANQNPAHLAELERERNEQLQFIRDQNKETEAQLFTEENKRNLEEIKQMNQMDLAEIIPVNNKKPKAAEAATEDSKNEEEKNDSPSKLAIVTEKADQVMIDTTG